MPITPTFPGLYIEELASNAHTIIAAPTSVTVVVGYTHPFKTPPGVFGTAVELFSFADYERAFGGLFASGIVDNSVPYAVNQFFLNGGADCWVIGLEARARDGSGAELGALPRAAATIGTIELTSLELTDRIPMFVTIDNLQNSDSVADVTIFYGPQAETYRGVTLDNSDANFLEPRINGVSSLVRVAPAGAYGTTFTAGSRQPFTFSLPSGFATTFSTLDYINIFQQDTSLDKVQIFNLLIMPGIADKSIWSAALAFCERKHAFAILDPPRQAAADDSLPPLKKIADLLAPFPTSTNAALYFPYVVAQDPLTSTEMELPPSGSVAGIFARIDQARGVWKAPAGLEATVNNTSGVVDRGRMTDRRHGTLNPLGVNCLREFSGIGTVVFGARTTVTRNTAFQQWWYVPVRRMALFLEQSLLANLKWVVFEPNDEPLWTAIRITIDNFMLSQFNQGAFQGSKPSQAFKVICDATTTTQDDIDKGIVNIVVAFAPLKPAEFVIIKIAQLAGQTQA